MLVGSTDRVRGATKRSHCHATLQVILLGSVQDRRRFTLTSDR
jgi:hypothetical protein